LTFAISSPDEFLFKLTRQKRGQYNYILSQHSHVYIRHAYGSRYTLIYSRHLKYKRPVKLSALATSATLQQGWFMRVERCVKQNKQASCPVIYHRRSARLT